MLLLVRAMLAWGAGHVCEWMMYTEPVMEGHDAGCVARSQCIRHFVMSQDREMHAEPETRFRCN